jgi:predicted nucleic acid-binding protein
VTLVVDASVALKWFVLEDLTDKARELLGVVEDLTAPRLITTEIANALAKKAAQKVLTADEALAHFNGFRLLLPGLIDIDDLVAPALENACALRHPVYDLIYLEAARRLDAQLVTADRRFAAKLADTDLAQHITLLSDWQPE